MPTKFEIGVCEDNFRRPPLLVIEKGQLRVLNFHVVVTANLTLKKHSHCVQSVFFAPRILKHKLD